MSSNLSKNSLMSLLLLPSSPKMGGLKVGRDRIVLGFNTENEFDSRTGFEEFVTGLSVFLRGTLEEQTRFCFSVYDIKR